MQKQLFKLLGNILAFYLATMIFSSIEVNSMWAIVYSGMALWLINLFIRPLLLLIALPVSLITLGLFSLVVNTWMVMLADTFVGGLDIPGFWPAFVIALMVSALNMLFKDLWVKNNY